MARQTFQGVLPKLSRIVHFLEKEEDNALTKPVLETPPELQGGETKRHNMGHKKHYVN